MGRDHKWVQDALSVMVTMFCRMGLETNLMNTKAMVCTLGFIWGKWGGESVKETGDRRRGKFSGEEEVAGK